MLIHKLILICAVAGAGSPVPEYNQDLGLEIAHPVGRSSFNAPETSVSGKLLNFNLAKLIRSGVSFGSILCLVSIENLK